jgi:hypothetical protein
MATVSLDKAGDMVGIDEMGFMNADEIRKRRQQLFVIFQRS